MNLIYGFTNLGVLFIKLGVLVIMALFEIDYFKALDIYVNDLSISMEIARVGWSLTVIQTEVSFEELYDSYLTGTLYTVPSTRTEKMPHLIYRK